MKKEQADIARPKLAPKWRIVFMRGTGTVEAPPLNTEALRNALVGINANEALWRALNQLVDVRLAAAANDMSNARVPESVVRAAGGAFEALSDLKADLWKLSGALP